jgi:hypothetical protein
MSEKTIPQNEVPFNGSETSEPNSTRRQFIGKSAAAIAGAGVAGAAANANGDPRMGLLGPDEKGIFDEVELNILQIEFAPQENPMRFIQSILNRGFRIGQVGFVTEDLDDEKIERLQEEFCEEDFKVGISTIPDGLPWKKSEPLPDTLREALAYRRTHLTDQEKKAIDKKVEQEMEQVDPNSWLRKTMKIRNRLTDEILKPRCAETLAALPEKIYVE